MDDLFKKFINTGVGFLSQGNKAMQTAIEKLVKESKLSEQEGKKIVDDLLKNSETKRADLEKQFKGLTDDLRTRVGLGAEEKKKAAPASKSKAAKPAAAKKPATSATAQAAGTVKKAADKVSAAAGKTQHSAAAKAGASKKAAPKATAGGSTHDAD
jgi:polyhydroxyalkanoate synthesis regulator phasin